MSNAQRCPQCGNGVPEGSRFCQDCGRPVTAGGGAKPKAKAKPSARPNMMKMMLGAGAAVLVIVAALVGVQFAQSGADSAEVPKGVIAGAGAMPDWLAAADASVAVEYAFAASHHDDLKYIPCYCGCGSSGHHSNSSCYFERDGQGSIKAYDSHAVG